MPAERLSSPSTSTFPWPAFARPYSPMLTGFDFKGFRIRLDRRKGLKLIVSKPGPKVEITAGGNPKQVKHFRVAAEKIIGALAQAK